MTMLVAAGWALLVSHQSGAATRTYASSELAAQTSSVANLLQTTPVVAEPSRLEITPSLQGKIENEEWDPFVTSTDSKTFFQWEPGVIYVAGSGPTGSDLLVSLDLGNNGWLVGDDNVEARVTMDASGNPSLSVRRLNAKNVAGPVWEELTGWALSSVVRASVEGGRVEYELRLSDAGLGLLPKRPTKVAARADIIPTSEPPLSSTQPRSLSPLTLVNNRAEGLPSTLHYEVEKDELAVPGDSVMVRFDFSAPKQTTQPPAKKINISGEGLMKDKLNDVTAPFPNFGSKPRCFVDYSSKISLDAEQGYHILKAVLTLSDDTPATVETSFQVAPVIDVEIDHSMVPVASSDRSVGITMGIKSNLRNPLKGSLTFSLDPKFKVLNRSNNQERFLLENRGKINRRFLLFVPANTKGTYPIEFDVEAGGKKSKVIRYITFG